MLRTGVRSELLWTIVVVVLAIVGIVALWPQDSDPASGDPQTSQWRVTGEKPFIAMPPDAELAPLRSGADLAPCPTPGGVGPLPGGPLAGITVPCLGAPGSVDLAAALAGRPALLNVWASWCTPCREEIPVLNAYAELPGAVPVVGIDVRDDATSALGLLADLDARYPSVVDTRGTLWAALQVPNAIPTSYVLRPDGSVRRVASPVVFTEPGEVARTVQRVLAEP